MNRLSTAVDRARGMLTGFTPGQRGVIVVAVIALVIGLVALSRWVAQPTWTQLYGDLSSSDASAIVEELQAQGVPYQLTAGGSTILVPQDQVYDVRLNLAGQGLPASSADGYSILDSQGITATDFQQNVAYRRALEAELARTLQAINGVNTAIVRLAMPAKDVFATEQDRPTASVLLALRAGADLSDEQVRSVTHLVAGGVEGLDPGDVTVTDSRGNMLSSKDTGADGAASRAGSVDDQTARFEDRLGTSVQQMLDTVLGPGNAVVRVNAQLDFDTRDTTTERYVQEDPKLQPQSEETVREGYVNGADASGGQLGVTWPDLEAAAGNADGGSYVKESHTVDNAIGKIVERAQSAPGSVERLTVAVILDERAAATVDPAQVQALVANAVGMDPARGDTVQVDRMPFDTTAASAAQAEMDAAQKAQQTADYIDLAKKAAIGLLVLIAVFVLTRRRKGSPRVDAVATDLPESPMMLGGAPPLIAAPPALPAEPEIDDSLERDRMRHDVAELVDRQPDEVASVIQGWLSGRG